MGVLADLGTQSGGSQTSRSEPASSVHSATNFLRSVTFSLLERLVNASSTVSGDAISGRSTNSLESAKMEAFWMVPSREP